MPRGYLKHEKRLVGRKKARGGGGKYTPCPKHFYTRPTITSKLDDPGRFHQDDYLDMLAEDSVYDHDICSRWENNEEIFWMAQEEEGTATIAAACDIASPAMLEDYSLCEKLSELSYVMDESEESDVQSKGASVAASFERIPAVESVVSFSTIADSTEVGQFEPETLSTYSSTPPQCAICFEVKPLASVIKKCSSCHPSACFDCLRRQYIVEAQKSHTSYPLKCFWPACDRVLRETQVQKFALNDSEMEAHYYMAWITKCLQKQAVADGVDIRAFPPEIVACLALAGGWASCPRCKAVITKNGGCDHMTCICGCEFSWGRCSSLYDDLTDRVRRRLESLGV